MISTRLHIARCICGVLVAILTTVAFSCICITLYREELRTQMIIATALCSALIAMISITMLLVETANSVSATSYGSRKTKTGSVILRFSQPSEIKRVSRKKYRNHLTGFSLHEGTTEQQGGGSTNKENN